MTISVQGRNRPGPFQAGRRPIQPGAITGGAVDSGDPPDDAPRFLAVSAKREASAAAGGQLVRLDVVAKPESQVTFPQAALAVPSSPRLVPGLVAALAAGAVGGAIALGIRSGGFGGLTFRSPTFAPGTVLFRP